MQKSVLQDYVNWSKTLLKTLLIMKLVIVIVLLSAFQVNAMPANGQNVNLKVKQTEIKKVLKLIENEGYYRFLYNAELKGLKNKVDFIARDLSISKSLTTLFDGTNLTFKQLDNNLIVVLSSVEEENNYARVTGKVTGENGEALAGATVLEKGTNNGVSTDNNGVYSITVKDDATLVISSIGYETAEVKVAGRSVVDVKLTVAIQKVDEVVVIGYGQASKRDLTGSIVKVAGKDVADKPNTNPVASLQGRVAGLSVVNNGTPGKAPDIRIRGTTSIGQSQPLYVVDGIFNDNIDYLNPNDIESIEILKDPSSLAIFGVRGATGVIAITTKRAKAGQVLINFNTAYGTKNLVNKIKFVDAEGFKTLFTEDQLNSGGTPYNFTGLTANTDWIDAVTRTAHFNNYNLSVSASTEKNKYNFGIGYIADEGIIRHEKLSKILLSFSDEVKLTKNIKLGINFNSSRQNNPYDATNVLNDARKVAPIFSAETKPFRIKNPYTPTGSDSINVDLYSGLDVSLQNNGVVNPLIKLENEWDKVIDIEYRNVASVFADISFLKHFNFRSTFYGDISNVNKRQYTPLYNSYNPLTLLPQVESSTTRIEENDNTYKKFQQDYILNYKQKFGEHALTLMGGFTTYYSGTFRRIGKASQFNPSIPTSLPIPDDKRLWYLSNGFNDPATQIATSEQFESSTVSYLARALYNYKGKYFFNASLRDDASSRIVGANQHQKFWALGAAWEVSKEDFFQKQHFLDYLKIKASTGVLGNQSAYLNNDPNIPLNYPFYPQLNLVQQPFQLDAGGVIVYNAATPKYAPSPDLKWETVDAKEVGVELEAFKRRLHFEANFFNKITNDLMTYIDRSSLGLLDKLVNGGKLRNRGIELSGNWNQNINKDFTISIGGNITFLKNRVLSLSEELPTGILNRRFENNGSAESRSQPGYPIGSFFGYIVEGIWQSNTEILRSTVIHQLDAIHPGDFKFKDINGDGILDAKDRTIIGNPTPDFIYGFNVNMAYKGFNLGVEMGGVYGNEVFRKWGSLEPPFQPVLNYPAEKLGRWHGEGTSNWVPILNPGNRINYNGSTYNIEDGSYLRLRNIQLGYNLPSKITTQLKMKNLRLFVNMQNPVTWKRNLGYTSEFGGDATAFGYDGGGGAIPAVTTFGLNVTF